MRTDTHIEEVQTCDFAAVAALYRETVFEHHDALFKAIFITGSYLRNITHEGVVILVAKQNGMVIGAIGLAAPSSLHNYSAAEDQLQAMLLGVAKTARKQGIAKALIRAAVTFAQTSGYESISAAVLNRNKKMQNLISKLPNIEFRGEMSNDGDEPATLLSLPTTPREPQPCYTSHSDTLTAADGSTEPPLPTTAAE